MNETICLWQLYNNNNNKIIMMIIIIHGGIEESRYCRIKPFVFFVFVANQDNIRFI